MTPSSPLQRFIAGMPDVLGCRRCREGEHYPVPIRMAFQPIVDSDSGEVFAYEALVRGPDGESACEVIAAVAPAQLYAFDQSCRVAAIETAMRLGLTTRLSINFLPNAVYDPASCIRITLAAAERFALPVERLMFELSEREQVRDLAHTLGIVRDYQQRGFVMAIDDFGSGHSGLNLLADIRPQVVKLDMGLCRGIHADRMRQAIVGGMVHTCAEAGCTLIAEGVETADELVTLHRLGVRLFQGYWFGRPELEALPRVDPAMLAPLAALRGG